MPQALTLAQHTLYAELRERALEMMFDEQFPGHGSFAKRVQKSREGQDREYYYYIGYRPGQEGPTKEKRYSRYVGPAGDPEIAIRVDRFKEIKAARKAPPHLHRVPACVKFTVEMVEGRHDG